MIGYIVAAVIVLIAIIGVALYLQVEKETRENLQRLKEEGFDLPTDVYKLIKAGRMDDAWLLQVHSSPYDPSLDGDRSGHTIFLRRQMGADIGRLAAETVQKQFIKKIEQHAKTLAIKKRQLVFTDEYGIKHTDDWDREKAKFIDNVLKFHGVNLIGALNKTTPQWKDFFVDIIPGTNLVGETDIFEDALNEARFGIEFEIDWIADQFFDDEDSSISIEDETPTGFELRCAEALEKHGFEVFTTPKTGDQGADVIADYDGYRLVCQCKKYSSPVGNKAVQEVLAAKEYYAGQMGVVISVAGYTKSATQLAENIDVLLIDFQDIPDFAKFVINTIENVEPTED